LRLFHLGFFCALILIAAGSVLAAPEEGAVTLVVEVKAGSAISVQDTLSFPEAGPGQPVEAALEVTVWSNVDWQLGVAATAAQRDTVPAVLDGELSVKAISGQWYAIDEVPIPVIDTVSKTTKDGATFAIPFRFTPGFGDEPGTYYITVEFTVVPAI